MLDKEKIRHISITIGLVLLICFAAISYDDNNYANASTVDIVTKDVKDDSLTFSATSPKLFMRGKKTIWVVIYTHIKKYSTEIKLYLRSQEMFPSTHLFQKTLFIWDSNDHSWQDVKDVFGSYIDVTDYMFYDLHNYTGSAEHLFDGSNCFHRDATYCRMLYVKTMIDEIAEEFCRISDRRVPDIYAIMDGDTYFHTLPLVRNVLDKNDKIMMSVCTTYLESFLPGVNEIFTPDALRLIRSANRETGYYNGMIYFPFYVWKDTLSNMREKIVELHGNDKSWLQIVLGLKQSMCEFCVIATYALGYEKERYRGLVIPIDAFGPANFHMSDTSVFDDATDASVPFTHIAIHDKVQLNRPHDSIRKGCCLSYKLNDSVCTGLTADDHFELIYLDNWGKKIGWGSPTILQDHYKHVSQLVTTYEDLFVRAKESCSDYITLYTSKESALKKYLETATRQNKKKFFTRGFHPFMHLA